MKEKKEVPETMFWKHRKVKKLEVLNPDDFHAPVEEILSYASSRLHDVSAVSDVKELKERNELVSYLWDRPHLRAKFSSWLLMESDSISLPNSENDFLYYYESEKNPYWELVKSFLNETSGQGAVPKKLQTFINNTKVALCMEQTEKIMATKIGQKLQQAAQMEGVVSMTIRNGEVIAQTNDIKNVIVGQKAYSSVWSNDYNAPIPRWCEAKFWRWIGVKALIQEKANMKAAEAAKKSSIIYSIPSSIYDDICAGLANKLSLYVLHPFFDRARTDYEERLSKFWLKMPSELHLKVFFSYEQSGLYISILNVRAAVNTSKKFASNYRLESYYDALTSEEKASYLQQLGEVDEELSYISSTYKALPLVKLMNKLLNIEIGEKIKISSPNTNHLFEWRYILNLYNSQEHNQEYKNLLKQRKYFWQGLTELAELTEILEFFESTAKRNNLPLCMPTITTDKVGVSFTDLAPINMLSQKKDMIPFSFPTINGRIICLTGKHGRGKSVAGQSVLENLWLAHAGFPVFAENFSTDIKEMIGSVTNDQGEGSTATVFARKTKTLFEGIAKIPAHKSLIFIDEIGKGTQEESGLRLGQQILRALNHNGNSVIFNTQIIRLAEYAKNDLGAICLQVNDSHQFEPGIGSGQMDALIKEVGLDKYLK